MRAGPGFSPQYTRDLIFALDLCGEKVYHSHRNVPNPFTFLGNKVDGADRMTDDISSEFDYVDTGDARRNRRVKKTGTRLAESPKLSIASAVADRSEREAVYELFRNDKVTPESILDSHFQKTEERASEFDVLLFLQDTTEFNLTRPHKQMKKLGTTSAANIFGMYLHLMLISNEHGTPLGLTSAKMWTRDPNRQTGKKRKYANKSNSPEERESYRWQEGARHTLEYAKAHPNQTCVCIGDSESDMLSVYALPREEAPNYHFIVRGYQKRYVRNKDAQTSELCTLREELAKQDSLAKFTVKSRTRTTTHQADGPRKLPRPARETELEVRAAALNFHKAPSKWKGLDIGVPVNVVYVSETEAEQLESIKRKEAPIEWILITSLPIDTTEDCLRIVQYYKTRWQIEIYFRTLKQGCAVEERRLGEYSSYLNCLSCYMIIAWHIMYIRYMMDSHPDESCELVFTRDEWQAVMFYATEGAKLPRKPPTLEEFVYLIAKLGGYKKNKKFPPGVQMIWEGLTKMNVVVQSWILFKRKGRKQE